MDERKVIKYQDGRGSDVELAVDIIKKYICKGRKDSVTDAEIYLFMMTCAHQRLNPFLNEIFLIKYTDKDPASIVVSKEALLERAENNQDFDGFRAGIIIRKDENEFEYREGSFLSDEEEGGDRRVGG